MNRVMSLVRSRLVLVLLALASVAFAVSSQPPAVAACVDAVIVYYYSDATYTTKVGQCAHACCQTWTCSGTLTQYSKIISRVSCDFQ